MGGIDDSGHLKPPSESISPCTVGILYGGGDLSAAFLSFKAILDLENALQVGSQALKLMQPL